MVIEGSWLQCFPDTLQLLAQLGHRRLELLHACCERRRRKEKAARFSAMLSARYADM